MRANKFLNPVKKDKKSKTYLKRARKLKTK
jgi:hypothetical protein